MTWCVLAVGVGGIAGSVVGGCWVLDLCTSGCGLCRLSNVFVVWCVLGVARGGRALFVWRWGCRLVLVFSNQINLRSSHGTRCLFTNLSCRCVGKAHGFKHGDLRYMHDFKHAVIAL